MATCTQCGEEYPDKRLALGIPICKTCGDQLAKDIAEQRKQQILPSHHKGGYVYVSPKQQRELLLQASSRDPRNEQPIRVNVVRAMYKKTKQVLNEGTVKWELVGWEFPVDKRTGIRYKRAILKKLE